jgi:hypothetical protein
VFARGSDIPPTLRRDAGLLADALSFHKSWQVREEQKRENSTYKYKEERTTTSQLHVAAYNS